MRTLRVKLYKFSELSKDAQQVAIDNNRFNFVDDEGWYESVYEDAREIGLKIKGFDIDRGNYCKGDFTLSANEVAQNIFNNHGEECETYKTAKSFMDEWQPIFNNYMDETHEYYESSESEDEMTELEDEFLKSLCEDYRVILTKEFEYQTSDDFISEMLDINNYEFKKDGTEF